MDGKLQSRMLALAARLLASEVIAVALSRVSSLRLLQGLDRRIVKEITGRCCVKNALLVARYVLK